jgi:endonuclease/exonuclease/phosphatase (EEP) superfamily protein YafD
MLVGEETGIRGGELPMWTRLRGGPWQRRRRWLARLAWCATLLLMVVAFSRMFFHDAAAPLTWLNAFTLYVYLPAYVALAVAMWTKRWWLATASAGVIACHFVWVLPDFRPATPYVPPSPTVEASRPLKIFYANVRGGRNMQMDEVLADALGNDPDVIVLAEMQGYWWHRMVRLNPLPSHPYGTNLKSRNSGDVGIFSRLPVRRMEQIIIGNRVVLVVDITLEAKRNLRLVALHSPRPNLNDRGEYDTFWQKLRPILMEEPGPTVVIGDFNATQHSLVYEQLEADGFRSAHEDRGRGYATTWPNGVNWIPPIRIDQAFLSSDVECLSIASGNGLGSDHKPFILDIQVRPSHE